MRIFIIHNHVPVQVIVDVGVASSSLGQDLSQLKGGENGSDLSKEADDHEDGVGHQKASVLQSGNGDADEANDEDVEAKDDDVGGGDKENF